MISPATLAHVRRAGLSLRTWRDQTLASALDPGYSPKSHRKSLWIAWGVMAAVGTAGAILAEAWWAPPGRRHGAGRGMVDCPPYCTPPPGG